MCILYIYSFGWFGSFGPFGVVGLDGFADFFNAFGLVFRCWCWFVSPFASFCTKIFFYTFFVYILIGVRKTAIK